MKKGLIITSSLSLLLAVFGTWEYYANHSTIANISQSIEQPGTGTIEKKASSSMIHTGIVTTGSTLPISTIPISQADIKNTNTSTYTDCSAKIDTSTETGQFCQKYYTQKNIEKMKKDIKLWAHPGGLTKNSSKIYSGATDSRSNM